MEIYKLYIIKNCYITEQDISEVSLPDIRDTLTKNKDTSLMFYLGVKVFTKDEYENTIITPNTINLSLMLLETDFIHCKTWDEFEDKLTQHILDTYKTSHIDIQNPERVVHQKSVTRQSGLDVSYTSLESPEVEGIPNLMWRLPDLIVRNKFKKGHKDYVDLNKCILSTNGFLSNPYHTDDGELIAPEHTTFLRSSDELNDPNIILLDFSDFAEFITVPFSKCKVSSLGANEHLGRVEYSDLSITIPGVDLTNKSVMVVLNHMLILNDSVHVTGRDTIHIEPRLYPLQNSHTVMMYHQGTYIPNTDILIDRDWTLPGYMKNTMTDKNHHGAFVIVFDTPDIFMYKAPLYMEYDNQSFGTKGPLGLLRKKSTWGFVDYVFTKYDNILHISTSHNNHTAVLDRDPLEPQIGLTYRRVRTNGLDFWDESNPHKEDTIKDIRKNDYEMIRIMC